MSAATAGEFLNSGQSLYAGQEIVSPQGKYKLVTQYDGNLVYYRTSDMMPRWYVQASDGYRAYMQGDGNFVFYNSSMAPKFNTQTQGNAGAYLRAQDDGNLIVYSASGAPLWNIGPDYGPLPAPSSSNQGIAAGTVLRANQYVFSPDARYYLVLQSDGNLVMYRSGNGSVRWSTQTNFGAWMSMQNDGNFVMYNQSGSAGWSTSTANHPGAYLTVQDDGNLVVYSGGNPVWNIGSDPSPPSQQALYATLGTVTIYGSGDVSFGSDVSYSPSFAGGSYSIGAPGAIQALALSVDQAIKSTSVCVAPVSAGAKTTTTQSDSTSRWLAAQEVFNFIQSRNLLNQVAIGSNGLAFMINGVKYRGFIVQYADGGQETWAINPGYASSTVKLLDEPMPGSLKVPTTPGSCN